MSESEGIDEKHGPHPAINIGLVIVGAAALGVLLYFNGRFGWSLGTTDADRVAYATLHILADLASAGLVAWSAAIAARGAWRWRVRAWVAFLCALGFTSVSILTVYGFMSTRIAAVQGHTAVLETQKGVAEWLKTQTVNPEVANAYAAAASECASGRGPRCLGAEARAQALAGQQANMGKELRQQFKQIEATASIVPDSHASAIASITGMSLGAAQKLLMIVMSAFGQSVKFACLFFGIKGLSQTIWRRRRTVSASPKGSSGEGGETRKTTNESKDKQPETVIQFPAKASAPAEFPAAQNARPTVSSEAARVPSPAPTVSGYPRLYGETVSSALRIQPEWPSQQAIADALGVTKGKVSKDIKKLKGQRKAETKRNGKANAVIARRNGGVLHAVI